MNWFKRLEFEPTQAMNNRDLTIRQRRRCTFMTTSLKIDSVSFQTISRLSQVAQRRKFMLELKRGGHARVQKEIVEFIALPFPSSKKLLNLVISRRSRAARQRNVQKSVMHV